MGEHTGDYNEVLYPSYLAVQCSPDRLAAMARLKGLTTAPPERCRMLELGCGDGASLIAFGYALPGSEFVGVDLAARPVEMGQARVAELGLGNVRLRCADVMDVDDSYGQFDFIFAHGLFSWVPEPVQKRVLEICRDRLTPHGVAYLSYNAYPGSYQRNMLRAMLEIHTAHLSDPLEKIRQSFGLINFIRSAPVRESPYHQFIEMVHGARGMVPPEAFLYDELGPLNQPFFFHEFAKLAAGYGLHFLSEAGFDQTVPLLSAELKASLNAIGDDVVRFEQYLDFLTGRSFRQTLLCREEAVLNRRRHWEALAELFFAAPVLSLPAEEKDQAGTRRFAAMNGRKVAVSDPGAQAALDYLGSVWPAIVSFAGISKAAGVTAGSEREAILGEHMLQFAEANLLSIHAQPFRLCGRLSEKPVASALARRQLDERFQANLFCEAVKVQDPLGRLVLARLDGTRTKADLVDELEAVLAAQHPESDEARAHILALRARLPEAVDKQLKDILDLGLLEA